MIVFEQESTERCVLILILKVCDDVRRSVYKVSRASTVRIPHPPKSPHSPTRYFSSVAILEGDSIMSTSEVPDPSLRTRSEGRNRVSGGVCEEFGKK